jgi:hypothetical protein
MICEVVYEERGTSICGWVSIIFSVGSFSILIINVYYDWIKYYLDKQNK